VRWRDVEVTREPSGRPVLRFHGRAAEVAAGLGVTLCHLSLSHDGDRALAFVVLEGAD
jgi:holo-[acyl-carrier protein] synthase